VFTDDRYVGEYTGHGDSERDVYDKQVLMLIRDPRDIVVSNFHQWKTTLNFYKIRPHELPTGKSQARLFGKVMNED
jgi:alcohol sulfotransferase